MLKDIVRNLAEPIGTYTLTEKMLSSDAKWDLEIQNLP